ncbi:hypothetical protein ACFO3J_17800 [Streptomyces polygonati]|uniref:Uncharacterized protein n=1 Tax=Streptomyces polygonati TaxID=1617087 RepID=A0ABV8HSR6_9ACTN
MAEAITEPIQLYTRRWMLAPATDQYGVDLGFEKGSQFWVVGRAGVLGSCPPEIAAAAIAFEPPAIVRRAWSAVPQGLSHHDVALEYKGVIVRWAERAFRDVDLEILAQVDLLGRRIAHAAPASLGVLFAGWRGLDPPESAAGRAGLTIHVLRELRGAAHICALAASGLTPLDAILAAPHPPPRTGPKYAERMGWVGPFREVSEIREARLDAEVLTSTILVPYFGVLSSRELGELREAITTVCQYDGGSRV